MSTVFAEPLEADGTTQEDGEQATAWRAGGNNFLGSGIERDMTVYVLCAKR